MVEPSITLLVALIYVVILFAIASYGDRSFAAVRNVSKPNLYALSMAIYCTTWTFFGSVGLASTSGFSFLAIYVGPILAITLGFPLMKRVIQLSKEERITSVADFLGARYGKNIRVAAVAAIIAVIGTIPYIALQLKAISSSVNTLLVRFDNGFPSGSGVFSDISLAVSLTLAAFAILFGTRHADATEHQHGMMLAIATESVVKLVAFLSVGVFVTFFMFDGVSDLFYQAAEDPKLNAVFTSEFDVGNFLILTALSLSVFLLLPRQFHVAVVENNSIRELERARWLFPLYLVAINLFVIPIAIAGTLRFGIAANADDYVLLLPILEGQRVLGLLVFLGGLSAGTAMVVVASVALAIMISNDLVLPLMLRRRASMGRTEPTDMGNQILNIRRTSILCVLILAYVYYKAADNSAALASIGLVSFAAVAQLAPAFFGGLFWKDANSRGAMLGMITGFVVWTYCLLLPTLLPTNSEFVRFGLFGIELLKPEALFGTNMSPIANGVVWSLFFNTLAFVLTSLSRRSNVQERHQASIFVPFHSPVARQKSIGSANIRIWQLREILARYLGEERAKRSLDSYIKEEGSRIEDEDFVDDGLLHHSEQLLASAIGASSSRLVHSLLIQQFDKNPDGNFELLDEASRALQYNHDVLKTALDQLEQGITVFDGNFRLASWNRKFRKILNLPAEVGRAGIGLSEIARAIATANNLDDQDPSGEQLAYRLINQKVAWQLHLPEQNEVLEISTNPMPEGGIVITWNNITERVRAAEALKEANETLEGRVEERTRELEQAKQLADQANASKTRFLAAAGHDILQPLNAARLYSATLKERVERDDNSQLADNISRSLGSVEEILGAVLAISRLDSPKVEVSVSNFALREITEQLQLEFDPIAKAEGLELRFVHSSSWVKSDKALLRRMLQNLISNALKFTREGKVLVGCRKRGDTLSLEVHDTGIGMDKEQQKRIFTEFTRLNDMAVEAPGLGLGLSIVDRTAKLLDHEVEVVSSKHKGTVFRIEVSKVAAVKAKAGQKGKKIKSNPGQISGMNVLCIDNDQSILDGMSVLLSEWGCYVSVASDEQEAINHVKEAVVQPDIILADYHLDNTTGISVFRRLQKIAPASIPGVLITADRTTEVKSKAENAGMTVLNKPVKPAALRAIISRHKPVQAAAE